MFGPRMGTSTFSFGKILGGLSKTLGVVNQVIPIYKEAKPIIQNAKTAFSLIKEMGSTTTNRIVNNTEKNMKQVKETISEISNNKINYSSQKGPTFFQ